MPPLCSMVRIAAAVMRSRIGPIVSESTEIRCRFGKNRRFVLILEWLTLCPTWTPLPVITHFRAIPHLEKTPHKNATRPLLGPRAGAFYPVEPGLVKPGLP